jgi:tetratricopeptide (TPR) repeat protein
MGARGIPRGAGYRAAGFKALARKKILGCLKKRNLLNSDKADAADLVALGQLYLEEDRLSDAIDFFEKAHHREGLIQLRERCLKEGDYFLYRRLAKILSLSPSPEEWAQLGDAALEHGKLHFSRSAYREGGLPEKLAQVERLLDAAAPEQTGEKGELH